MKNFNVMKLNGDKVHCNCTKYLKPKVCMHSLFLLDYLSIQHVDPRYCGFPLVPSRKISRKKTRGALTRTSTSSPIIPIVPASSEIVSTAEEGREDETQNLTVIDSQLVFRRSRRLLGRQNI
uniref:SWIM-type domain-containing protein n=1 Tax=Rhabditophanes sp. KR3021 TaxID=114890 RepID=A0AC35TWV3_9BILA